MMTQLIQALHYPSNIATIPNWTLEEITTGWKRARESMSSSLSAVNFGHHMAGTFNPTIAIFNAHLANLGFTTGYLLKQWQTGLTSC